MLKFYEVSDNFTKCGFASVVVVNSLFIFLTAIHITKIDRTYKKMVVVFASTGILFSGWELIARPFVHNHNGGFIYFSLNTWLHWPVEILQLALAVYAGFYSVILSFIAVQFLFRLSTLLSVTTVKKFGGRGMIVWISYPIISGVVYASSCLFFGRPDKYSDEYLRETLIEEYGLAIEEVPRLVMIAYNADGSFRWNSLFFIIGCGSDILIQYIIIIYCGIRMHITMKQQFNILSASYRKLQKQFIRALVFQTVAPTLLFVFPAALVLLGPLVNAKMDFQTGWIYASLSLYPPIDSVVFMLVVSEYSQVLKEIFGYLFLKKSSPSEGISSALQ